LKRLRGCCGSWDWRLSERAAPTEWPRHDAPAEARSDPRASPSQTSKSQTRGSPRIRSPNPEASLCALNQIVGTQRRPATTQTPLPLSTGSTSTETIARTPIAATRALPIKLPSRRSKAQKSSTEILHRRSTAFSTIAVGSLQMAGLDLLSTGLEVARIVSMKTSSVRLSKSGSDAGCACTH